MNRLFMNLLEDEITKEEWLKLSKTDRENYEYISDAKGCYFKQKEETSAVINEVDDYERLINKGEKNNG